MQKAQSASIGLSEGDLEEIKSRSSNQIKSDEQENFPLKQEQKSTNLFQNKSYTVATTNPITVSTDSTYNPEIDLQLSDQCQLKQYSYSHCRFITNEVDFPTMISVLKVQKWIGIDIEQSFQLTYVPFTCLIQVSCEEATFLIDVLHQDIKGLMTEYFGEILCSPKIVKIFFSGIQDLTWLWRDFRLEVINYFDVKEFALAIKLKTEYVSLYGMIQEFCGVELNRDMKKVLQVSEWSNRPLSQAQLDYAAQDAFYLPFIRKNLIQESFIRNGEENTINNIRNLESFTKIEKKTHEQKDFLANCKKIIQKLKIKLNSQQKQYLYFISYGRDRISKTHNVNPQVFLNDNYILDFIVAHVCQKPNSNTPKIENQTTKSQQEQKKIESEKNKKSDQKNQEQKNERTDGKGPEKKCAQKNSPKENPETKAPQQKNLKCSEKNKGQQKQQAQSIQQEKQLDQQKQNNQSTQLKTFPVVENQTLVSRQLTNEPQQSEHATNQDLNTGVEAQEISTSQSKQTKEKTNSKFPSSSAITEKIIQPQTTNEVEQNQEASRIASFELQSEEQIKVYNRLLLKCLEENNMIEKERLIEFNQILEEVLSNWEIFRESTGQMKLEENATQQLEKEQKKKERFLQYQEKYCSKKPVYSNCSIESPDGLKLCNCDEKKIHWYLQRELADLVTEKPLVIRLRFLPGGKGHSELEEEVKKENFYYVTERENICVICGNDKNYLKFHIVPLLYRRHFPNRFKSHRSHDVLLICTTCHEKANQAIDKMKQQVAKEYQIDEIGQNKAQFIRSAVLTLVKVSNSFWKNKSQMPKESRFRQKQIIREEFARILDIEQLKDQCESFLCNLHSGKKGFKIDQAFVDVVKSLKQFEKIGKQVSNVDFKSQEGLLVVQKLKSEEEIIEFIRRWRIYFCEQMKPQFLPSAWQIDHKFTRNFGVSSVFNQDFIHEDKQHNEDDDFFEDEEETNPNKCKISSKQQNSTQQPQDDELKKFRPVDLQAEQQDDLQKSQNSKKNKQENKTEQRPGNVQVAQSVELNDPMELILKNQAIPLID